MWASNHDVLSYKYACHLIRINDCDMTIIYSSVNQIRFCWIMVQRCFIRIFLCASERGIKIVRVSHQGNSSVIQTLSSICKMFLMTLISSWNNRSLRAEDWIMKRGSWPKIWIHRFLLNQGNHCPHHCHLLSAMQVGLDWSRFLIEEFMQGNSRFKAFKAGFVQHGIPGWWAYKLL